MKRWQYVYIRQDAVRFSRHCVDRVLEKTEALDVHDVDLAWGGRTLLQHHVCVVEINFVFADGNFLHAEGTCFVLRTCAPKPRV